MAFTLDDALKSASLAAKQQQSASDKRALYGIPGELNSASLSSSSEASSSSSSPVDTVTTTPSSTSSNDATTTTMDPLDSESITLKDNDGKDSPAEGAIILGASLDRPSSSDDSDDTKTEDDQRIVFIERLMGLHLSGAPGPDGQSLDTLSSGQGSDGQSEDGPSKGIKWASRTRKFTFPLGSASITASGPIGNDVSNDGPIPHPMLRYAAAAMMSRLIAAAARAQMEAQAREAIMSRMSPGAKDKDDDAGDDESVPVLLASLRTEDSSRFGGNSNFGANPNFASPPFGRPSSPMYGRPMARSRGPRPAMSSMNHRVMVPPPQAPSSGVHPLLAQLQALHALSRLQMKQREGRTGSASILTNGGQIGEEIELSRGPSSPSGRGQPALVMVAIPIGAESQVRPSGPSMVHPSMMSPYAHGPMSGYAGALPSPVVSQYPRAYSPYHPTAAAYTRPLPHPVSYALPMGSYHQPSYHQPSYHQPSYHGQSMASYHGHPSVSASHPHASYYRPPPPVSHYRNPYMRQVIEVPVEVPVPVHVPVPVAYPVGVHPSMARMDHPMGPAAHPIMAHQMVSHPSRVMASADDSDGQEGHQDQIVLFYDAELHDKEGSENESGSSSGSHDANTGNNDDLQSSASEHRSLDRSEGQRSLLPMGIRGQSQHHPLFMIPSRSLERSMGMERSLDRTTGQERMSGQAPTPANLNRLRLLREIAKRSEAIMSATSSSGPRIFPLGEESADVVQGRPAVQASASDSVLGQPAFIVLAQDDATGNNNGPVERR